MNHLKNILINIFYSLFRLLPVACKTGLIKIGDPDKNSPVLLTCNYHLTVHRVKKAVSGLDCYLLIANSRGINVWCAATGGLFTNHDIISILKTSGIEDLVMHRNVILPQLAATGIESATIYKKTGWKIFWGPVQVQDIPSYLSNNYIKSVQMRCVKFPLQHRIEMVASWAFPLSIISAILLMVISPAYMIPILSLIWGLSMIIFILFPLYSKWLNTSKSKLINFSRGGLQLIVWGLFVLGIILFSLFRATLDWGFIMRWSVISLMIILLISFDLMGSTPTFKSGFHEDRLLNIAIDEDKCQGIGSCVDVCPRDCYEMDIRRQVIVMSRGESCVQCAACIVQCPCDALYFKSPSSQIVTPDSVRKYKLNIVGKRMLKMD
jgi:NAD-dependent dihydropyrimidine dehydrogenase PreA subunit